MEYGRSSRIELTNGHWSIRSSIMWINWLLNRIHRMTESKRAPSMCVCVGFRLQSSFYKYSITMVKWNKDFDYCANVEPNRFVKFRTNEKPFSSTTMNIYARRIVFFLFHFDCSCFNSLGHFWFIVSNKNFGLILL